MRLHKTKIDRKKYKVKSKNKTGCPVVYIYKTNKHFTLQLFCPKSKVTKLSSSDLNIKKATPEILDMTLSQKLDLVLKDFEQKMLSYHSVNNINKLAFYFRDKRYGGSIEKIVSYIKNIKFETQ